MAVHCSLFLWGASQAAIAAVSGRALERRPHQEQPLPRRSHGKNRGIDAATMPTLPALRRSVVTTILTCLLRLLTAVDRLIVTVNRHPAGARRVAQLVALLAVLKLVRWRRVDGQAAQGREIAQVITILTHCPFVDWRERVAAAKRERIL